MSNRAWRALFIIVGVILLTMMLYVHEAIPGLELLIGVVVGVLLIVAGIRGRVL